MKYFKFMNLTWHSAKILTLPSVGSVGVLQALQTWSSRFQKIFADFLLNFPVGSRCRSPGFIAGSARLRAGIALPSCGAGQHRDSSGTAPAAPRSARPPSLPFPGAVIPHLLCLRSAGNWAFESCGFVRGERILQALLAEKQNRLGPCMKLQLKSMEGERIFHPLIITADEQTMTTFCPLGLVIEMKNLKPLSVVFCLKFWKMLPADCIQMYSLVACGIAGFCQQFQRQQSLFSSDPGRGTISTWLMYLKLCFLYIVLIVLQSVPYNGEAFMRRST